jgi:hypothetical protein
MICSGSDSEVSFWQNRLGKNLIGPALWGGLVFRGKQARSPRGWEMSFPLPSSDSGPPWRESSAWAKVEV